jgi:iron complex outermembrane receptor protein
MKWFATMLSLSIWMSGYSKNEVSHIEGALFESESVSLPFATIALFNSSDSTLYKASTSDINGFFEFENIPFGTYDLHFSYIGFNTKKQKLSVDKPKIVLPKIILQRDENTLQEVSVSAIRPMVEVKADKTVFNVEGTINASGSDALSLLKKAPGVTVDNNNNISVKGKGGVVVYIDDKRTILSNEDLASYLQTLNSSQIESLEIISNPSAKYDAEGGAGIINIRLKKQQQENANAIINAGYAQGFYPKWDASITSNYKKNKLNVFLNYGYNNAQYRSFQHFDRLQGGYQFKINTIHRSWNKSHNIKLGADYALNKNHTVGFQVNTNLVPGNQWYNDTDSDIGFEDQPFDQTLIAKTINPSERKNMSYNLNYRYRDTLDRSFTMDIDQSSFSLNQYSIRQNTYVDYLNRAEISSLFFDNDIATDITLWSGKVDYEQNIGKGKWSVGGKYAQAITQNSFDFIDIVGGVKTINIDKTNDFSYTEEIIAAYTMYSITLSKWNIQTGLRYENTHSIGNLVSLSAQNDKNVERNYENWFPNVGISYDLGKESSWGASFSRRIDRPDYQMLNPFEYKLSAINYRKGNPFLQPEYIQSYELNYTYKGFLTLAGSYSNTKNFYADVVLPYDSIASVETPYNLAKSQSVNLSPSVYLPLKKWWVMYTSLWVNYMHNQADLGEGNIVDVKNTWGGIYWQNTFTLPKDINIELSGWAETGGIWQGNMKTGPMGALDFGLQKKVWNKKGTIKLSVTDLFFTSQWTVDARINGMITTGGGGWESRLAKINFTYILGNDKLKTSARKTALDEEQQRLKGKD